MEVEKTGAPACRVIGSRKTTAELMGAGTRHKAKKEFKKEEKKAKKEVIKTRVSRE